MKPILYLLAGSALFCALTPANAMAERPAYDKKIEEAAAIQLIGKLGDLRGPLAIKPGEYIFPPVEFRVPDYEAARPGVMRELRVGFSAS